MKAAGKRTCPTILVLDVTCKQISKCIIILFLGANCSSTFQGQLLHLDVDPRAPGEHEENTRAPRGNITQRVLASPGWSKTDGGQVGQHRHR